MKLNIVENSMNKGYINLSAIKEHLSGIARIIEYGSIHPEKNKRYFNPSNDHIQNYIIKMSEGRLSKGEYNGFVRQIEGNGECSVGFWKVNRLAIKDGKSDEVARPYGKFASYYKDGSFKNEDGI